MKIIKALQENYKDYTKKVFLFMGSLHTPVSLIRLPDGSYVLPDAYTGVINFSSASSSLAFSSSGNTIDFTASGSSGISSLTGNTGGAISPTSGNINILGSGNIAINGSGSSLTISDTGGVSVNWNDSATTTTMATNNGYIVQAGAQVFTLPATSAVGDTIEVLLAAGTSWQIAQAAGQSIVVNGSTTTVGVGGSITTTGAGQTIKLTCVTANTKWQTTSLIGNPTVV